MCGLAGFFTPGGLHAEQAQALAREMAGDLCHRGPDDEGVWVDGPAGIALSHRRLSIVDLSPLGHQPMASTSGRFVIVYNGEVYNYRDLQRQLSDGGHRFRGHSDTEVLLAAIEEWGLQGALQRANGMYAIALWDRRDRVLHLCRDRAGEKPMYYGWAGNTLLFGSELKALRRHPDFRPEVDLEALALYVRHNHVPAPFTIYRGFHKLPPATILSISAENRHPEPVAYWSLAAAAEAGTRDPLVDGATAAADRLDALLADAVGLRMHADVPLGAFLSGGVDSSLVVALMQAQSSRAVRTFTIGFEDPRYDEAQAARQVADHLGTDHTQLYVSPEDALDVIPRLPRIYDEPFADSSQIPTFLIADMTRRHVVVSLSGDAGDELFGGYNRYVWGEKIRGWTRGLPQPARQLLAAALLAPRPSAWEALSRFSGGRIPAQIGDRTLAGRMTQIAHLVRARDAGEVYRSFVSHWADPARLLRGVTEPPVLRGFLARSGTVDGLTQRMMLLDALSYLPDDILVKVDRASMAVGLEARVPFLDHRVIEFAWQVPLSLKIRDGVGKWLLREVLYRYVPRDLIDRPKKGFSVPVGAWLRGPLREWAESLLSRERLRQEGFFDVGMVESVWSEHLSGGQNREAQLWVVLMFQAWLDSYGEVLTPLDSCLAEAAGRG